MTEEQKATAKSVWITLAPYIGVVILDIALCGLLVVSGKELTVEAALAITGCVGALLFLHKKDGANTIAGGTLVIMASLFLGCGTPCLVEQNIVSALDAGLGVAEDQIDENSPETHLTMRIAQGALAVGQAAVESCSLVRGKLGWVDWVIWALESALGVAVLFGAAGPDTPEDPPDELMHAIDLLEAEYR